MIGCSDLVPLCYPCARFFCYLCAQSVPAPHRPQRGTSPSPRVVFDALHFFIPPSTIGLRFSTFRGRRAGIEVDWRADSRTNCSCRLPPVHQRMRSGSCDLVRRIGMVDSATPHPDPSGGQAPALHFFIPPSTIGLQSGTFRRWRAGIEVDWRADSRTDCSCRLPPVHQGMRSGSCDLVRRIGMVDSATPVRLGTWVTLRPST